METSLLRRIIYLCFFISGITGLSYEVVWGKYLKLFIGATSHAHVIVLATFMGGLALGNAFFGRLADRQKFTLKLYAYLELGIGLFCMLFPTIFESAIKLYFSLAEPDPTSIYNMVLKFFLSALTLLPPTILMGGTLPVLSKFLVRRLREAGERIGLLYFINSAGAAAGCLIAGFYLISTFGLQLSMISMASVNILIGTVFLYLKRFEDRFETPENDREEAVVSATPQNQARLYSDSQIRAAYFFIFISGILSMVYELVWIRLLSMVLGSSTYSFSIMLFTFITGISIGAIFASHLMKKERDAYWLFAVAEFGVFFTLIVMIPMYERVPFYFNLLDSLLSHNIDAFWLYNTIKVLVCVLLMALPTFFIGMTLPLAGRVAVRQVKVLGTGLGSAFSLNTLGNLIGAGVGGLVIIPVLQLQPSIEISSLMSGLVGAGLLFADKSRSFPRRVIPFLGVVVFFAIFKMVTSPWDAYTINSGVFRESGKVADTFEAYRASVNSDIRVVYYENDADMSILVAQSKLSKNLWYKANGKTEASTLSDMNTQLLVAHLPLLFHKDPKEVMLLGLGSGATAGAILKHPIERLDLAEISKAVVNASRYFDEFTGAPLDDPRTRLTIADGKEFLLLKPQAAYDVIISEPSNPWIAGVGNLFSIEFFNVAKSHLKPGGIMVQWFHLYEMGDPLVTCVLNSFGSVFPYATVWNVGTDIIVLGTMEPLKVNFTEVENRLFSPPVALDLTRPTLNGMIYSMPRLLANQYMSEERFRVSFPGNGRLNSDYFPVLEYEAPKYLFANSKPYNFWKQDERFSFSMNSKLFINQLMNVRKLETSDYTSLVTFFGERSSANEKAIGNGILQAILNYSEKDASVSQVYLQYGDLLLYGQSKLWKQRIETGGLTPEEWEEYALFAKTRFLSSITTYANPDFMAFEEALSFCREGAPEKAPMFEKIRYETYNGMGVSVLVNFDEAP